MKILLVGDYSNVHATLAKGLRALGHEVTVVSDGDGWKNYPRDIDIKRPSMNKLLTLCYYFKLRRIWRRLRGYDVVQIINPEIVPLRAEKQWPFYEALRKHNCKVFLAAFGMDHYWVKAGLDCHTFRYSDFNLGADVRADIPENEQFIADWLYGPKGALNKRVAADCDGIIAGLYEYYASYQAQSEFADKLTYIPFPIECRRDVQISDLTPEKIRFFIGIQRTRNAYKGTDIMLRALERIEREMPERVEVRRVENVPFAEYCALMQGSDVILDQLYSYTPAMNALEAMNQGLIVVGGGEPENYEILNETDLHCIINVQPNEESVYLALKDLVLHPERIPQLKHDSVSYIKKHHDCVKVAKEYLDFWTRIT